MAHTVIPPPRCTATTLELTHKGNINDKTITKRDREVGDFNVTLLAVPSPVVDRIRNANVTNDPNCKGTSMFQHLGSLLL